MARSPKAIVDPALLVWARTTRRLEIEIAAKKLQVPPARLEAWEAGEASPSVSQLRKMADIYRRPLAMFFLPAVPVEPAEPHDFRRVQGAEAAALSAELSLAIRKARAQRETALELALSLGEEPRTLDLRVETSDAPEDVAAELRGLLGVTLDAQFATRNPHESLRLWRSAFEARGILVFQAGGVDVQEMRGFSVPGEPYPVIVVNSKDAPRARAFSLLHEATHLLLDEGGLCDFHEGPGTPQIEVFCNAVAG